MDLKNIIEYITHFYSVPGMYAINRVEDIYFLIFGFECSALIAKEDDCHSFNRSFRPFVNWYFNTKEDIDWVRLIRYHAGPNDLNSIKLFGKLVEEFLASPYGLQFKGTISK